MEWLFIARKSEIVKSYCFQTNIKINRSTSNIEFFSVGILICKTQPKLAAQTALSAGKRLNQYNTFENQQIKYWGGMNSKVPYISMLYPIVDVHRRTDY